MLQEIDKNVWLVEGEIVDFHGFAYPTRSVIIRLANGGLWVWSPIALKPELAAVIDALAPVTHLVSPNKIHHLYLSEWAAKYPSARLWGPQSVIDKRQDLNFAAALGDAPPEAWQGEITQFWFQGSVFMDEIVFFHVASRTAILADLSENFSDQFLRQHWRWWQWPIAKFWRITEGWGYAPLEWRLSFLKRDRARKARARLLASEPEKVIMAHGEWQRSNGGDFLARSLRWLG
jgi:hypothetical protein